MGRIRRREFTVALVVGVIALALLPVSPSDRTAAAPEIPRLVGKVQSYRVEPNESLLEIARRYDLGFNAIVAANPTLDPWVPPAGSVIDLPTAWILPDLKNRRGIVVNIPELRLYFFAAPSGPVATFPLGIGDQGRDTPVGSYTVVQKTTRPAWHVPKSLRTENPGLPKVIPPGPDNPLGSHALRLSRGGILIHGTNRPWGIGRRSSHGCLRLYPEDIVKLFRLVGKGTPVLVISQAVKACSVGEKVFLEAHRVEGGEGTEGRVGRAMQYLADKRLLGRTDFAKLITAVEEMKGMPVDVTLVP